MVLAGQFLERPALVDAGGLVLEALFHRGSRRPALLVCPPAAGGGMDAPAVAELAWAAARAGHPSLRFQHRGVGASQGEPDAARALDDAEAALRHLAETCGARVAVAGLLSGCDTALALARAHPEIDRVALISPAAAPGPPWPAARVRVLLPGAGAPLPRGEVEAALGVAGDVEGVEGLDAALGAGLPRLGRVLVAWISGRAER